VNRDVTTVNRYRKKAISVTWQRRTVTLDLPVDVFSSFQLDRGTALLLRMLMEAGRHWGHAFDLGCGYGPIALCLATLELAERIEATDRDALAVLFANWNAAQNRAANICARGGLDYQNGPAARCDLVISNIPAKVGESVHRLLLFGAADHLVETGEVWIVAVAPLEGEIDRILAHPAVRVLDKRAKQDHVVYRYVFAGRPDLPDSPYHRCRQRFSWGGHAYDLDAAYGLPEFDTLSLATEAVLRDLGPAARASPLRRVLVWNPGQGHLPILVPRMSASLERLAICSRDLLALRTTQNNLQKNGFAGPLATYHAAGIGALDNETDLDLMVGILNESEGIDICREEIRDAVAGHPGTPLLVGCSSSFAGRLSPALKKQGIRTRVGTKGKGFCALTCHAG